MPANRSHAVWEQRHGLLVGNSKGCRLLYRGAVEWVLFRQVVGELVTSVEALVRPTLPFANPKRVSSDVVWLEPLLLAEVSYSELMEEDRLRDPVLRELHVVPRCPPGR